MKIVSILLLSLSSIIILAGAFFKIMHWPGASLMILFGMVLIFAGVSLLLYESYNKNKNETKDLDF